MNGNLNLICFVGNASGLNKKLNTFDTHELSLNYTDLTVAKDGRALLTWLLQAIKSQYQVVNTISQPVHLKQSVLKHH